MSLHDVKYQLCPIRLAKEHSYDRQKVKVALNRHTDRGAGRFMNPDKLRVLKEDAIEECRKYEEVTKLMSRSAPTNSWNNLSTRIVGIEGWEPADNPYDQRKQAIATNGRGKEEK